MIVELQIMKSKGEKILGQGGKIATVNYHVWMYGKFVIILMSSRQKEGLGRP